MTRAEIDLMLASDTQAPSVARRSMGDLEERLTEEHLEWARLLVSEVVTNSVVHAGLGPEDWVRLRVVLNADVVRFEVTDSGPGFEILSFEDHSPPGNGVSGWGLYLVDELAERWGVLTEEHTCVWFELSCGAGES